MVDGRKRISWGKSAAYNLKAAYNQNRKDSSQNAAKAGRDIVANVKSIPDNPEKFPLDKYTRNNDVTYRAFEQHRYREVCRVLPTEIRVMTIRHTGMEPSDY